MYRFEVEPGQNVMVLVLHGMQDGWEARLMHLEWPKRSEQVAEGWTLILDFSEYLGGVHNTEKEQSKLARYMAKAPFAKCMAIKPVNEELAKPFFDHLSCEMYDSFAEAWRAAGGKDRSVMLPPPEDGTKYPANNPPAQV